MDDVNKKIGQDKRVIQLLNFILQSNNGTRRTNMQYITQLWRLLQFIYCTQNDEISELNKGQNDNAAEAETTFGEKEVAFPGWTMQGIETQREIMGSKKTVIPIIKIKWFLVWPFGEDRRKQMLKWICKWIPPPHERKNMRNRQGAGLKMSMTQQPLRDSRNGRMDKNGNWEVRVATIVKKIKKLFLSIFLHESVLNIYNIASYIFVGAI